MLLLALSCHVTAQEPLNDC